MHFQVKNTCYAAIENCWAAVTATAPFCFFYINCFPYIHFITLYLLSSFFPSIKILTGETFICSAAICGCFHKKLSSPSARTSHVPFKSFTSCCFSLPLYTIQSVFHSSAFSFVWLSTYKPTQPSVSTFLRCVLPPVRFYPTIPAAFFAV